MIAVQSSDFTCREDNLDDYLFYHTIDLPGLGVMPGEVDLRYAPDDYLGNIIVTNKRVLDMGTASGFLSFHMENKGASVVSYDLPPNDNWDIVPHASREGATQEKITLASERRNRMRKINNAYRLSHRLLNSRAELVRGTAFAVPDLVGLVDITTFGNIREHVSNPLLAIQQAACITRETIVITERLDTTRQPVIDRLFGWLGTSAVRKICHRLVEPSGLSQPLVAIGNLEETGQSLTPELLVEFLRVLDFGDVRISYHRQHLAQHNKTILMYTLVANRTVSLRSV